MKELILGALITITSASGVNDSSYNDDSYSGSSLEFLRSESYCLAENVYFEARNQPLIGQAAVISVVMNRIHDPRFPSTICEVVKQGLHRQGDSGVMIPILYKCQFSWYCDGVSDQIDDPRAFDPILSLAVAVVTGDYVLIDNTYGATHYHANYIEPSWAKTKTKTTRIEDHIFYRWE